MRKPLRSLRMTFLAAALAITAFQAVPQAAQANYCWREGDCWACCDSCCAMACPWGDSQWC